jgi:L-alanine-DL-glutamate epimerase-like enolase superfamily enzyme
VSWSISALYIFHTIPQAVRLLTRWNTDFGIDFAEAPVPIDPVENMRELRAKVPVALCANEGLSRVEDCLQVIRSRCSDVLCFSSYWVGSLRNFLNLSWAAHWEGQQVCKLTHGELGIAAAGQHVLLAIPNATGGAQQTASIMDGDILKTPPPIASGPKWGRIEQPGLGIEIDEEKLQYYHECYLRDGQFLPYQSEQKT